ncbi:MAG: hypothetical protein QOG21_1917 [Actinomycetota bacterium]|nr:hypothetical protein [Actinomycetota bacterium]
MRLCKRAVRFLVVFALLLAPGIANASGSAMSATGGVHWTIGPEVFGAPVISQPLTFTSRKTTDGIVSGSFEYHQRFDGATSRFTGRVTCMNVYDGYRAKIGGLILSSNDPTVEVGSYGWFQVFDNGEGAAASPDQSSLMGFGDAAANEAFCASPNLPRFGPWDVQGNVQVKG